MPRCVEPEFLDALAPNDPRAIRSRKDLRRINAWMGNPGIIAGALGGIFNGGSPKTMADIGAGDGILMLRVASKIAKQGDGRSVRLVDRQAIVSPQTLSALESIGWHAGVLQTDILDWLRQPPGEQFDVIIANLFLHHFCDEKLSELLSGAAKRARAFVAVEPRRWNWALAFSRLVGLIGCSSVTRHDAVASVRAGFAGHELSRLWPSGDGWLLEERPANWYSHLFIAKRAS
jgi:hypothetical protein